MPSDPISNLRSQQKPKFQAVESLYAEVAWAGLESYTGVRTFQPEFPGAAGEVGSRIMQQNLLPDGYVQVLCSDAKTRRMKYEFYPRNGMHRLNVPNDVPGVGWARANKAGIAVIQRGANNSITFTILQPGEQANAIIARSIALGTWGKTPTRLYGWF